MAMYLHHTTILQETLIARWGGGAQEFVIIELDLHTSLAVHSAAEADEIIKAGVAAKALLLGEAGESPKAKAVPMCDATLPLSRTGELKCTLDDGHYGAHSALGGARRWLGTGDDARREDGTRAVPGTAGAS